MRYRVISNIRKDGRDYEPGSEIELTDDQAAKISHAIGPIPVTVEVLSRLPDGHPGGLIVASENAEGLTLPAGVATVNISASQDETQIPTPELTAKKRGRK